MQPIHYILALLAGMLMPIQSAINHKLSTYVQTPVVSAFISFIIGGIALLIFLIISGTPISLSGAKNAPLITWAGGICGAFFCNDRCNGRTPIRYGAHVWHFNPGANDHNLTY